MSEIEADVIKEDNGKSVMWKKGLLRLCIGAALVLGAIGYALPYLAVRKEITIEAGNARPQLSAFLRWESRFAGLISGLGEDTDMNRVADYEVVISAYGRLLTCVLHVRDTQAPAVTTKAQSILVDDTLEPERFIEKVEDATSVIISFETEPDWAAAGVYEAALLITDEGKNVTRATAELEILADTEPPVISGAKEITVVEGGNVSYKRDITVTDNHDESVVLVVDNSEVDLNTAGEYTVTYSATDAAGNTAVVTAPVHVEAPTLETATEETINREADKILEKILTEDMTMYEQAEAIYWWCHENIAYADHSAKVNYIQGAYQGLVNRKGDCYTYAMTAKCLLTRAGIPNLDIERIPDGDSLHYWNLIDVGEGWYHFDTTRRADGATFFYMNDADITAYSEAHDNCHNYDRSKYPEIN